MARTTDRLIVALGLPLLGLLIVLSWVPRDCPVIKRALIGCPVPNVGEPTDAQRELNRFPHQDLSTGTADFAVPAETNRAHTRIAFYYRADAPSAAAALRVQTKDGFRSLALVTHPLFANLSWNRVAEGDPDATLYEANPSGTSIPDALKHYTKTQLIADPAAAALYGLKDSEYTGITNGSVLTPEVSAILTTYGPPIPDGSWLSFEHVLNLSDAIVGNDGKLHFQILINTPDGTKFHLGEVHVQYRN